MAGPELDRRSAMAIGLMGAAAAGGAGLSVPAEAATADTLMADVAHYAGLGIHLTGSPGDLATLDWIEARVARLGFRVERQPVVYRDHAIDAAHIAAGDVRVDGIPQRPARLTGPDGVVARLVLADRPEATPGIAGAIALVRLPFARHSSITEARVARPVKAALAAGCAGLVLVTQGPSAEALALNSPVAHPVGALPTLVVAPRDAAPLVAAADAGREARLVIDGAPAEVASANIVARRPGKGRTIVVTTPLSGWFTCAGERGTGIAAFLHAAALLADRLPDADLLFAGLVAHEREYHGGELFVAERAPKPEAVRLWVHIGANFAARDWHEASETLLLPLPSPDAQRYLIAPDRWLDAIRTDLKGVPGMESPYPASLETAGGEAGHILRKGYGPIIASFGAHRLHHARTDLAAAVDPASLEATWRGWSKAVLRAATSLAPA